MGRSVDTSADVRRLSDPRADDTDPGVGDPHGADLSHPGPDGTGPDEAGLGGLGGEVIRAQRGDPDAFRVLYRDIQPRLVRYLHALVGDDAEDIASETWLQVTRDLAGFSGDYDHFRGWITTIARHRALDHLRHHARRPPALPIPAEDLATRAAPDDTAEGAMEALSTTAALALIATLPADQAEAVLLRTVLGLDAQSAARVLGKRPGAVRTAAYRGLRTLAKRLDAGLPGLTGGASEASEASGAGPARARVRLTGDMRTRGIPSR
jgi:RNA polymerase sigma-70 factor, ECF subfamily